ncbi:DUF5994 family protein [Nocardioides sp. P5_C9_2]
MSTPTPSLPAPPLPTTDDRRAAGPATAVGPLRLRLVADARPGHLDGGWWPRSRDLATELVLLAEDLPAHLGRLSHVQCSAPDWDGDVDEVRVAGRPVVVASSTLDDPLQDDTHHVELTTDLTTLRLLVVPPGFNDADGEEALLAAATPGNDHSAGDLLRAVTDEADVDPRDHWRHDGTAGWGDDTPTPSPRRVGSR